MLLDQPKKESEKETFVVKFVEMDPESETDLKAKISTEANVEKKNTVETEKEVEKLKEGNIEPLSTKERESRLKEVLDKKEKEKQEKAAKRERERKIKENREKEKRAKEERKKLVKEEKALKSRAKHTKSKPEKVELRSKGRKAVCSIEEIQDPDEGTSGLESVKPVEKTTECVYKRPKSYHTYVNIADFEHNIVVIREISETESKPLSSGAKSEPTLSSIPREGSQKVTVTEGASILAGSRQNVKKKVSKSRKGGSGCLLCMSKKGHLGSMEDNRNIEEPISPTTKHIVENRQLFTELRAQNFDVICFATYRTACKLRFIQKRTNLHIVDIWNVIEAFRENGLNSLEGYTEVPLARLESLLSTLFYALNKRLPTNAQINVEESINMVLFWMAASYDPESKGKIKVFSIKVGLSTLCSGKLMDKLRYLFTQMSDPSGFLIRSKFEDYLKDVLAIPTSVYEGPSFGYNDSAGRSCFDGRNKVNVNDFLEKLMSDPGPQCLLWLPILHRMATVENVLHPVVCEVCKRGSFTGFRYKCHRCYNYQQCQDCFWRGRVSGNHSTDHEMKEYSSYKSPAKQISHTLRKSFRCVPTKPTNSRIPHFPETPEKTLDLSHIVPPTPPPVHNGFNDTSLGRQSGISDVSSMESSSATKSPSKILQGSFDSTRIDDEHRLIARYAARLAADANNAARSPTELNYSLDSNKAQRELIAQLEAKNREIMREIQRLRIEQEAHAKVTPDVQPRNPTLLTELRLLRQRRDELEARMAALQESRRELMVQLEGLMKLLKSHGGSPRSTPNSSPRSRMAGGSPPGTYPGTRGHSAPTTPGDSLAGLGGDVRQAFSQHNSGASTTGSVRSLRNDLLVAADSVTNAMSSLVKELNSEASSGSEDEDDLINNRHHRRNHEVDELQAWQAEMQQKLQQETDFLRQLRARKGKHVRSASDSEHYIPTDEGDDGFGADDAESYVKTDDESYVMKTDDEIYAELYDQDPKELIPQRYTTDDETGLETDQESYIRTDDEEGGQSEWEEAMKRWVNR